MSEKWEVDLMDDCVDETDIEVLDSDGFPVAIIEWMPILNRYDEKYPDRHWPELEGVTFKKRSKKENVKLAHRIAALPELEANYKEAVEALKEFVECFDETRSQFAGQHLQIRNSIYDRAKAALAKAEGK